MNSLLINEPIRKYHLWQYFDLALENSVVASVRE